MQRTPKDRLSRYLALGVLPDGTRDILGLWIENTEGVKFWMKVFNDLRTQGVADLLIVVTDSLKGMPEALAAVFPVTTLQTCIVHLIRNSLDCARWQIRRFNREWIIPGGAKIAKTSSGLQAA